MRVAILIVLLISLPASAAEISGQLSLTSAGKALRSSEAVDAVVYFRPAEPVEVQPAPQPYLMGTRRKTFLPRALPITVGSSVRFPNEDPILHNAFSTSKDNAFDVGLYGRGEGSTHVFTRAGLVRVYCNVHHSMVGHILVLDTPYFARPDANGRFRLSGVPDGMRGELFIWHERAPLWRRALVAGSDGELPVALDLKRKRVPPHMNKFGKPYRRGDDGKY